MTKTESILSETISWQSNAKSRILSLVTIGQVLQQTRDGLHANQIGALRELLRTGKKPEYDTEKKNLPAVVFCGTFHESRKIEEISRYNSICVIDIDHVAPEELEGVSDRLSEDPFVLAHWLSPSGAGVKGLVQFAYSSPFAIDFAYQNHKTAFGQLSEYFRTKHELELDQSGSDITRLCFLSSDSKTVIKEDFDQFPIDLGLAVPVGRAKLSKTRKPPFVSKQKSLVFDKLAFMNGRGKNKAVDRYFIQRCIRYLERRGLSVTTGYDRWYKIAYAVANSFTYDLGERYYLKLCRLDGAAHSEAASIRMLQSCYMNSKRAFMIATLKFYFDRTKEMWGE